MNRSLIALIFSLLMVSSSWAGDHCDLSEAVGFQLSTGRILGVKDNVQSYKLVVRSEACKNSRSGDDCTEAFNPNIDVSDVVRRDLGQRFNTHPSALIFGQKPGFRQPANMKSGALVGKCL